MPYEVQDTFAGLSVLLTGATGYVGSVLLERLLSSCRGLRRVLVLVRPRKGLSPADRTRALLDKKLYWKLSEEAKRKVEVLEGDVSLPGLGLSERDASRVRREVGVVFHVAATINFSAPLHRALAINVGGTAAVLDLAKTIQDLKALVHVSTAFANCLIEETITEKIYTNKWNPRELMKVIQNLSPAYIREHEKEFLGAHPNTYSFTKQLSENLIATEGADLPVAIVRPSMVLCTVEEPLAGWLENVQTGTFGFIAGAGRGVFRTIRVNSSVPGDWVPADYFAAFLIAAAWRASRTRKLEVYHFTSGLKNRLLWSDLVSCIMRNLERYPTTNAVFYPRAKCRSGALRNWLVVLLFHYLPALVMDLFGQVSDAPAKILDLQKKYARGSTYASYFTLYDWRFCNKNTQQLWSILPEKDKKNFWFSMDGFDWNRYIEICVLGVREHYHRQDPSSIPASKFRNKCLKAVYVTCWIIFSCIMYSVFSFHYTSMTSLIFSLLLVLFLYWV